MMTEQLRRAFAEAAKLSPKEQDAFGEWMLLELESEKRWAQLFADSQDMLEALGAEALEEHRRGETQVLDVENL